MIMIAARTHDSGRDSFAEKGELSMTCRNHRVMTKR